MSALDQLIPVCGCHGGRGWQLSPRTYLPCFDPCFTLLSKLRCRAKRSRSGACPTPSTTSCHKIFTGVLFLLQVEKVKERCLPDALNYPMLEEYDFKHWFIC